MRNHLGVELIAVKVLLAPGFVVAASLAARRYGPRVGGLIAGLPVVAGPILLIYALSDGASFAAGAAAGTLLGLVSLIAFVVVYGRLAGHVFWGASMVAGWAAFIAGTVIFSAFSIPAGAALAIAGVAILLGLAWLPRPSDAPREQFTPPAWDLPLRAFCALVLVVTLTAVSAQLGAQLSGLLAPFPIISTVLATFTHAQRGNDELLRLLRAMVLGFCAFALFCFTLAVTLPTIAVAPSFALATAVALITQGTLILLTGRAARASAPLMAAAAEAQPSRAAG